MQEDFNKVLQDVRNTDNPGVKAIRLSMHLSNMLRTDKISIYEAYLLNGEVINYEREGYIMPAWNGRVNISICLAILNQRLLALAFKDAEYANILKEFGLEALHLCKEKRKHYIMDNYIEYINIDYKSINFLQYLYDIRQDYNELSFDDGPYHNERFPYDYYVPEKVLLDKEELQNKKNISSDIEELLIELSI